MNQKMLKKFKKKNRGKTYVHLGDKTVKKSGKWLQLNLR